MKTRKCKRPMGKNFLNSIKIWKNFFAGIAPLICLIFFFSAAFNAQADRLSHLSDRISDSAPGAPANHEIKFTLGQNIPAAGKIIITPEGGEFGIPADFDYTDADLAAGAHGIYDNRNLAPVSDNSSDGVEIVSGANGNITINLNSSTGISAGQEILIKLGDWAVYGDQGDKLITNPENIGSFRINISTYDSLGGLLDTADALIAIIEPVGVSSSMAKIRANGAPTGVLISGTLQTIMSLTTNFDAICRYSTASGTPYANMADRFASTGEHFHSTIITGLASGNYYNYYVRCQDVSTEIVDLDDYVIAFSVEQVGGGSGGTGGGTGGGIGDGTGSGSGGGGGGGGAGPGGPSRVPTLPFPPLPDNPILTMSGWASPYAEVILLKDGKEYLKSSASQSAKFKFEIKELPEAVYTFGVFAIDTENRKSRAYTTTFWIKQDSKTELSAIITPPTMELNKVNLAEGEALTAAGQSAPNAEIELLIEPDRAGVTEIDIIRKQGNAGADGKWSMTAETRGLAKGIYKIKSRALLKETGYSDYSYTINIGLGEEIKQLSCPGADLNHDKKVNLADFSIMLYYWGTNNACADQNQDGRVNIIDFSILLYNWTG